MVETDQVPPAGQRYIPEAPARCTAAEAESSKVLVLDIINICYGKEVALAASLCYDLPHEDNCKSPTHSSRQQRGI